MHKSYSYSNSRNADKFVVRMPDGLRDKLTDVAMERHVAMNTIAVWALEAALNNKRNWIPQIGQPVTFQDESHVFVITGFGGTRAGLTLVAESGTGGLRIDLAHEFNPITL